jgi:hypothetical protein
MEEVKQGVTPVESPTTPVEETASQPVEGQKQEVGTETTPAQGQEQSSAPVAEDVNWKNRALEYERKLRETVDSLPKIIEETISKSSPKQEATPQYSVEQLEVFAEQTDDVNSKLWAKAEIKKLEEQRFAKIIDERVGAVEQRKNFELRKNEVEREVSNDARYSDAFVTDASGRKVWNNASPLTQIASNYIKDPDISKRPDGLAIAMKLAYADYSTMKSGVVESKVESLKKENTKLKQSTLVDGGSNIQVPKANPLSQAKDDLAKTGSKSALRTLVQAHLKAQGII